MTDQTIPAPQNKPAETADEVIHYAIFTLATKAALDGMIAEWPALASPVVKTLLSKLLNWMGGYIYTALARLVTFSIIDLQTGSEKDAYVKAEGALRAAHLSGDPNALNQAVTDYKAALARIVHFDGIAPA